MAHQLRIGEVAQLLGISTKTIRHYQRLGLLDDTARSDAGYRLFTAADLLRLLRIRRLQGLGLPLAKIREALATREAQASLRAALAELLRDVDRQLAVLQARRERIEALLADPSVDLADAPSDEPPTLAMARERLGDQLARVSPELWEQEARIFRSLDAVQWPEGYRDTVEAALSYYQRHPDEYRAWLAFSERIAALAREPEDSPEVDALVEAYRRLLRDYPPGEDAPAGLAMPAQLAGLAHDMMVASLAPAQRKLYEKLAALSNETAPSPSESHGR